MNEDENAIGQIAANFTGWFFSLIPILGRIPELACTILSVIFQFDREENTTHFDKFFLDSRNYPSPSLYMKTQERFTLNYQTIISNFAGNFVSEVFSIFSLLYSILSLIFWPIDIILILTGSWGTKFFFACLSSISPIYWLIMDKNKWYPITDNG